jgi:ABC-type transport system involved in cytochrome c biogenesis ATPase subunit
MIRPIATRLCSIDLLPLGVDDPRLLAAAQSQRFALARLYLDHARLLWVR